jgi:hypothetical protein
MCTSLFRDALACKGLKVKMLVCAEILASAYNLIHHLFIKINKIWINQWFKITNSHLHTPPLLLMLVSNHSKVILLVYYLLKKICTKIWHSFFIGTQSISITLICMWCGQTCFNDIFLETEGVDTIIEIDKRKARGRRNQCAVFYTPIGRCVQVYFIIHLHARGLRYFQICFSSTINALTQVVFTRPWVHNLFHYVMQQYVLSELFSVNH